MKVNLSDLRREYISQGISLEKFSTNPMDQFKIWFDEALALKIEDANAMVLSTSKRSIVSSRTVLLKAFDKKGFYFFTNYNSEKGSDIKSNANVSLLFFWKELSRQIIIQGKAKKVSSKESQTYFYSRPFLSQVAAIVSNQSHELKSRGNLEQKFHELLAQYENKKVPFPKFWGGYMIAPSEIEFWQGRPNRLHDRVIYKKKGTKWVKSLLYP